MSGRRTPEARVKIRGDEPIPQDIYPVLDTDLARDNVENDLPAADLEDLRSSESEDKG